MLRQHPGLSFGQRPKDNRLASAVESVLRSGGQRHLKSGQRRRADGRDGLFNRSLLAAPLTYVALSDHEVRRLTDLPRRGPDPRIQDLDALAGLEIQVGETDDAAAHAIVLRRGDSEG